jgi:peptidoglycan/LPS O-acetylase OafA/YrhL
MFGLDAWIKSGLPRITGTIFISTVDAGFFLIVIGALYLQRGLALRLLTSRPLQILGLMCYSIYVWHGLILIHFFPNFQTNVADTLRYYPAYLATIIAISAMTYRFIEFRSVSDWRPLFLLKPNGLE